MAKDTEKLIRQLSLISFLMAQGRPVSALEIKREVEGYSVMNEDAFARRFYADRAELDSLGIELQVDRPGEGFFEAELYSLPPENFYLPAIEFSDDELAALRTSLSLLTEGEFAYAEPLRLALQQVAWGHPNPLVDPDNTPISMAKFASTSSRELTQRLARIETAISRHISVHFRYHTNQRNEISDRKVDPYHLVFRGGQFYLIGYSHEREAVRVFRLSRILGKVGYATKSEHDFTPPEEFERRDYADLVKRLESATHKERYTLLEYEPNMGDCLAACDLVLARSGGSVFELTARGRPAVLVPYPHATGDHQTANAEWMADAGAAEVITDDDLSADLITESVNRILDDEATLEVMAAASLTLARPDAAADIAEEVLKFAGAPK